MQAVYNFFAICAVQWRMFIVYFHINIISWIIMWHVQCMCVCVCVFIYCIWKAVIGTIAPWLLPILLFLMEYIWFMSFWFTPTFPGTQLGHKTRATSIYTCMYPHVNGKGTQWCWKCKGTGMVWETPGMFCPMLWSRVALQFWHLQKHFLCFLVKPRLYIQGAYKLSEDFVTP